MKKVKERAGQGSLQKSPFSSRRQRKQDNITPLWIWQENYIFQEL